MHVLGDRVVTTLKEARVHDLDEVGVDVVVVDDELAVDLGEGDDALGELAGLAGAALQQHAFHPAA